MNDINKNLLLRHIAKSDLTALEKRYLENLVGASKTQASSSKDYNKVGHWIDPPVGVNDSTYCSLCNWHPYGDLYTRYCPGCGAYMED